MQRIVFKAAIASLMIALVASLWTAPSIGQNDKQIEKVMQALPEKAPAKPKAKRKVLIFSKTAGFRHGSIAIGAKAIAMMGDKTGAFTAHHTEDESFFEPEKLKTFDAVWMMNTTGACLKPGAKFVDDKGETIFGAKDAQVDQKTVVVDEKGKAIEGAKVAKIDGKDVGVDADGKAIPKAKLTKTGGRTAIVDAKGQELPTAKKITPDPQREELLKKSLADFIASGKGLAGCHSATDTYQNWKDYNQMMGGAFVSHPWSQKVPVKNLEPKHPLNAAFDGKDFEISDEIYMFRDDTALPSDRRILLSLDGDKMDLTKQKRKNGQYPISWCGTFGKGRTFYCSLGHGEHIYWDPKVLQHYLAGLQYVLGDLDVDATPSSK
jgi:type 1 glutamine amidotransferase